MPPSPNSIEALALGADAILLDNMSPEDLKRAVALAKGRAVLEASGNVTATNARAIAESGASIISVQAPSRIRRPTWDLGLDI